MGKDRRNFLKQSALLGLTGLAGSLLGKETLNHLSNIDQAFVPESPYTLPALPYAYDALEPFIDKETMAIHHSKHHQAYVDKLNKALENYKGNGNLLELFKTASSIDPALRNNGGGHYNHSLFWQLMRAKGNEQMAMPQGKLAEAINFTFRDFETFKSAFSDKALKIFGSGWCWLIVTNGALKISTTANQDNPLMDLSIDKGTPVLALDVWEHAYYLKYQNKRADYINNWWNLVNWQYAEGLYNEVTSK